MSPDGIEGQFQLLRYLLVLHPVKKTASRRRAVKFRKALDIFFRSFPVLCPDDVVQGILLIVSDGVEGQSRNRLSIQRHSLTAHPVLLFEQVQRGVARYGPKPGTELAAREIVGLYLPEGLFETARADVVDRKVIDILQPPLQE